MIENSTLETKELIKLNLGCGEDHKPGYVNVDKFGNPNIQLDLETFPWPWENNTVQEIMMIHILEHLGKTSEIYLRIIQELYRICVKDARIDIRVPHPRHDIFMHDPTHVRPITPEGLGLFSKRRNQQWIDTNSSNSLLGIYLNVDFEIENASFKLDDPWEIKLRNKEVTAIEIQRALSLYNNVAIESQIQLRVIK